MSIYVYVCEGKHVVCIWKRFLYFLYFCKLREREREKEARVRERDREREREIDR